MRTDLFSALIILLNVITACNNSSNTTAIKAPTKHDKVAAIPTAQPASPTSDCDNALWKYVYDPDRLQVLEKCKTVTGVIEESNAGGDVVPSAALELQHTLDFGLFGIALNGGRSHASNTSER